MNTACMATFPARREQLQNTVESLLPQVDQLRIYLNEYSSVPDFLVHDKIAVEIDGPDLGDAGKVANLPDEGFTFLVDDDIIYPPDYVKVLTSAIETYGREAVVGCHAAVVMPPVRNYFNDRRVYHFNSYVAKHTAVNVLGTGCLAYHTDYVDFDLSDAPCSNMLDVHFAVWCQTHRKRMRTVARPGGWLESQKVPTSLWATRGAGETQTYYINTVEKWTVF